MNKTALNRVGKQPELFGKAEYSGSFGGVEHEMLKLVARQAFKSPKSRNVPNALGLLIRFGFAHWPEVWSQVLRDTKYTQAEGFGGRRGYGSYWRALMRRHLEQAPPAN